MEVEFSVWHFRKAAKRAFWVSERVKTIFQYGQKYREKQSFSKFHFIVYINLASSNEAFSAVTARLPSFVCSEPWVMAAVTGGDIRNAIAKTKRKRRC